MTSHTWQRPLVGCPLNPTPQPVKGKPFMFTVSFLKKKPKFSSISSRPLAHFAAHWPPVSRVQAWLWPRALVSTPWLACAVAPSVLLSMFVCSPPPPPLMGEASLGHASLLRGGSEHLAFGAPQFVRMFSLSFPKSLEPGKELQKNKLLIKVRNVCLIRLSSCKEEGSCMTVMTRMFMS